MEPTMQKSTEQPSSAVWRVGDPTLLTQNLLKVFEEGNKVLAGYMSKPNGADPMSLSRDAQEAGRVLGEVVQQWLREPQRLAAAQAELVTGYMELWSRSMRRMMGETVEPVAKPELGDNRFKDPDWIENPFFDFWKQAYLLTSRWAEALVDQTEGLDPKTKHKAEFFIRQIITATSPSNFALTNPEVMRETFQSHGENLLRGMQQLSVDMARSNGVLQISQTDTSAFEVGTNVATTPGKVVFQNDLFQLIQYTPTTPSVHETPLLIVPPWINKYYILDLQPAKSFVKYAVAQGFTLFMISWVNPDERLSHKTFEDYMREGILTASDAVTEATGVEKINILGYCVGGTLLGTTLAYLAGKGIDRYRSATFLAAQMDFSKAGDLLVFIDDAQLKALEEMMAERGYLDGSAMANVFNMLRPRDLIWPYIVNNYLLGRKPFPFDLLFWNQDSTRMAAANHKFYLREFYHENKFSRGLMELGGVRLDLKRVKIPVYELATREDHIAPARSVLVGAQLFGGPVRYVLAGSGHIAGVINPPDKVKYQHWTSDRLAPSLEKWLESAEEHPGSWWPDWINWLKRHSGQTVAPRFPGDAELSIIEDAPGSYVKVKS
jgi:polyhydroxyalkanoate synthase